MVPENLHVSSENITSRPIVCDENENVDKLLKEAKVIVDSLG